MSILNPALFGTVHLRVPYDPVDRVTPVMEEHVRNQQHEALRVEIEHQLADILEQDRKIVRKELLELSENTKTAYKSDYRQFVEWTKAQGYPSRPMLPEVVAAYFLAKSAEGASPRVLERHVSAIKFVARLSDDPRCADESVVKAMLRFIRRNWDGESEPSKQPPDKPKHKAKEAV